MEEESTILVMDAFCVLTSVIACTGVHCGLKYQQWSMKQTLGVDQEGCQWHNVPI